MEPSKIMEKNSPVLNGRGYCEQCRHCSARVEPGSKTIALVCRLNPPTASAALLMTPQGQAQWQVACIWPQVNKDDFCGKFEPQRN